MYEKSRNAVIRSREMAPAALVLFLVGALMGSFCPRGARDALSAGRALDEFVVGGGEGEASIRLSVDGEDAKLVIEDSKGRRLAMFGVEARTSAFPELTGTWGVPTLALFSRDDGASIISLTGDPGPEQGEGGEGEGGDLERSPGPRWRAEARVGVGRSFLVSAEPRTGLYFAANFGAGQVFRELLAEDFK